MLSNFLFSKNLTFKTVSGKKKIVFGGKLTMIVLTILVILAVASTILAVKVIRGLGDMGDTARTAYHD